MVRRKKTNIDSSIATLFLGLLFVFFYTTLVTQVHTQSDVSSLNDNVVVATHSVVTKPIEDSNIIIGGIPAKIIKKDIGWDRENFYPYSKKNGEI